MGAPKKGTRIELGEFDHQQLQQHAAANPSSGFKLAVVQEPVTGKAIASALRARGMKWPVEPPPVLEISSMEQDAQKWLYIHNPNFFCVAELVAIGVPPATKKSNAKKDNKEGMKDNLSGLLASSLHKVKNPDDRKEHGYFVFGDLNVRDPGRYKLCFTLFEMRRYDIQVYAAKIDTAISHEFNVLGPKSNVPTKDSTRLSKLLSESGVKIRLRKESTKRKQISHDWSSGTAQNLNWAATHGQRTLSNLTTPNHSRPEPNSRYSRNAGEDVGGRLSISHNDPSPRFPPPPPYAGPSGGPGSMDHPGSVGRAPFSNHGGFVDHTSSVGHPIQMNHANVMARAPDMHHTGAIGHAGPLGHTGYINHAGQDGSVLPYGTATSMPMPGYDYQNLPPAQRQEQWTGNGNGRVVDWVPQQWTPQ